MLPDPEAQALLDMAAAAGGPRLYEMSPDDARTASKRLISLIGAGPQIHAVRDHLAPGASGDVPVRCLRPEASEPGSTIVYLHGGGWVLGPGLDNSETLGRTLARASGGEVVLVDYRLAPEHRHPAATQDALAAVRWAAQHAPGRPLIVAGDSAGGNLAAVCALQARDEAGPRIDGQVLIYPITDHDFTRPSYREHGDGLLLGRNEMEWFWDHYVPDRGQRDRPDASPLRAADHSGLPPAFVLIDEYDPLRDEGLAYAEVLRAAGVATTVARYDEVMHGFFSFVNYLSSADRAVAEVGDWISRVVATVNTRPS